MVQNQILQIDSEEKVTLEVISQLVNLNDIKEMDRLDFTKRSRWFSASFRCQKAFLTGYIKEGANFATGNHMKREPIDVGLVVSKISLK